MSEPIRTHARRRAGQTILAAALAIVVAGCGANATQPTTPPATPVVTPTPAALPSAPATTDGSALSLGAGDVDRILSEGTYHVGAPFAMPFSIALPAGLRVEALKEGDASFSLEQDWITIQVFENLFADPCHADGGAIDPPSPRTVEAIIAGFDAMPGFTVGDVSDVDVGGHPGKAFVLTNTVDTSTTACSDGLMLPIWTSLGGSKTSTNGGLDEQLWVVDVDGTPVIIGRGGPGIDPVAASIAFD